MDHSLAGAVVAPPPMVRRFAGIPLAWWVAFGTTIGLGLGYSGFIAAIVGQFLHPISEANGWSRAETNGAFSLALAVTVILAPVSGAAVDRWGAPRVLLIGAITLPIAIACLTFTQGRLWLFYTGMVAVSICGSLTLPATYTSITLRWFDHHRGIGFGFALSGAGLAQIIMPPIIQHVIARSGWQIAILTVAAIMMTVVVPLALAFRARPRGAWEMDGGLKVPERQATHAATSGLALREGLRSRKLWQLVIIFILLGMGTFGLLANYPAMLRDADFSADQMVQLIALQGMVNIVARVGTGWILDHFPPRASACIIAGCPTFGILLLVYGLDGSMMRAAVASTLIAIGIGGEMDVMSFFVSRYFKRDVYAKFAGFTHSSFNVGGAVGTPLLAACYDYYGSYHYGLIGMAVAVATAAILIATLPRIERDGHAT